MGGLRAICSPLLLSLLLVLSGCASLSGLLSSPREPAARAAPFDILGRVLVSYDGRAFTANVRWLHTADSDDLWLMTPTGQALAYLREDSAGATLTSADQTQYRATQIESLSKRALGWELPIRRLMHEVLDSGYRGVFDLEVLGSHYENHYNNKPPNDPATLVKVIPEAVSHPVLTGIPAQELPVMVENVWDRPHGVQSIRLPMRARAALMSARVTAAPASAKASAVVSPMPELAPVTSATWPSKS